MKYVLLEYYTMNYYTVQNQQKTVIFPIISIL